MLKLFVLLIAVVCCNACRLEMMNSQDTTDSPQTGCSDSDGNPHEFYTEWLNGPETCVCVDFGIICCERFWENTVPPIPESTPRIIADYFGAFTENDVGEPEEPINNEESAAPEVPNQPDSSDSPEVIADDSHESHESAEDNK